MIVVGVLGALVNVAAAWALSRANRASLNVEGAYRTCSPTSLVAVAPPSPAS